MSGRGVSEKKLKELEYYFTGYGSQHDKTILKLIREYRRHKKAFEKLKIIPKNVHSSSDHVIYMEDILSKLDLGSDFNE